MKRITLVSVVIVLFLIASLTPAMAQRGDDAKRKSKNAKVEAVAEGVKITLEFGKPSVRGRKIFGKLVPYGKIWRTGADEATTISFDKDVAIEGKKLAAGTYSLFTIPGQKEWVIVFNKVAKQWGAYKYDINKDALRIKVKSSTAPPLEVMDFKVKDKSIILHWETVSVAFNVGKAK